MSRSEETKKAPNASFIKAFEIKALANQSLSERAAGVLVAYFGTARFFYFILVLVTAWIAVNLGWVPWIRAFDPYPFILLTMIASVAAILMTIIILVSQNRQANINTLRNELLLQMVLITEKELTKALRLLSEQLRSRQVDHVVDVELHEMLKDTDVSEIEKELEEQLSKNRQ